MLRGRSYLRQHFSLTLNITIQQAVHARHETRICIHIKSEGAMMHRRNTHFWPYNSSTLWDLLRYKRIQNQHLWRTIETLREWRSWFDVRLPSTSLQVQGRAAHRLNIGLAKVIYCNVMISSPRLPTIMITMLRRGTSSHACASTANSFTSFA